MCIIIICIIYVFSLLFDILHLINFIVCMYIYNIIQQYVSCDICHVIIIQVLCFFTRVLFNASQHLNDNLTPLKPVRQSMMCIKYSENIIICVPKVRHKIHHTTSHLLLSLPKSVALSN